MSIATHREAQASPGISPRTVDAAQSSANTPRQSLTVVDGVALLVGLVVGIGIFRTPQIVAANVGSEWAFIAVWIAGGAITLIGAFIYAELGSAYPKYGRRIPLSAPGHRPAGGAALRLGTADRDPDRRHRRGRLRVR